MVVYIRIHRKFPNDSICIASVNSQNHRVHGNFHLLFKIGVWLFMNIPKAFVSTFGQTPKHIVPLPMLI